MALRIKTLRTSQGLTQEYLAEKAGMSRSQLAMIESETRPANTIRLNAIAAALGVQLEELFESGSADRDILDIIRTLDATDRALLVNMAEALAAKKR